MAKAFVSHVEWCCRDIEKTAAFLRALFDWDFKPFGNNYLLYSPEHGPAVGLLRSDLINQGDGCLVYVTVNDIDHHLSLATSLGAQVKETKTYIPDYGWYAQVKDSDNNIVGLFEGLK